MLKGRVEDLPLAMTDPTIQMCALTTVYEKMQCDDMKGLKRRLEETALALERAQMEREDLRSRIGVLEDQVAQEAEARVQAERATQVLVAFWPTRRRL